MAQITGNDTVTDASITAIKSNNADAISDNNSTTAAMGNSDSLMTAFESFEYTNHIMFHKLLKSLTNHGGVNACNDDTDSDTDSTMAVKRDNPDSVQGDVDNCSSQLCFDDDEPAELSTVSFSDTITFLLGEFDERLHDVKASVCHFTMLTVKNVANWFSNATKLEWLYYNALLLFLTSAVGLQLAMTAPFFSVTVPLTVLLGQAFIDNLIDPDASASLAVAIPLDDILIRYMRLWSKYLFSLLVTADIYQQVFRGATGTETSMRKWIGYFKPFLVTKIPFFMGPRMGYCLLTKLFEVFLLSASLLVVLLQAGLDVVRAMRSGWHGRWHSRALVNLALLLVVLLTFDMMEILLDALDLLEIVWEALVLGFD
ncbi:uncharacterized protein K452DRAFT_296918 [Aplosporella prunicola CBS 121167]|uniref:Uncharacterized protein n=1 Tax=Aplosporella prunicola CBS 121167 TaxID=1176127 RepID=A0A6A6BHP8_9PEZI|nr:uncharacterized protein K452DRAFT_296918 [Aplosporella prunicola CBS 121167]KAF2143128.1 hypothetical protein K452DRAFT_296918 [Aplosporella prunicola CBS 121167]